MLDFIQHTKHLVRFFYYMTIDLTNINNRILYWIDYSIQSNQYRSEADFIKKLGLATARTKLSDIKRKKANFTLGDVVIILTHHTELNPSWIIKGDGNMLLTNEEKPEQELVNELKRLNKTNLELQERYEKVLVELGRYKERLDKYEPSAKADQAV